MDFKTARWNDDRALRRVPVIHISISKRYFKIHFSFRHQEFLPSLHVGANLNVQMMT